MRRFRQFSAAVMATTAALVMAACGSGGGSADPNAPATLSWWHNGNTDPLLTVWQRAADDYHTAHPNITFQISPIQNEDIKTKIQLALQGDTPPSVFQQWGGGQEASQLASGKLADLTSSVSGWISELGKAAAGWQVDGKQYGVPYDLHVVGFWYRKDLFERAGIAGPPSTMDELDVDVAKLKNAGITPVALGGKDRWPDAYYWDYFAVRECPTPVLRSSISSQKMTDPCFLKAGQDVKAFLDTNPFQDGFLGTPAQQGASSATGLVANGQAAMELQGDWEPSAMASLTEDKALDAKMGWFPFPAVAGGAGDPSVALGGGDGFSCSTTAPPACADFLKFVDSPDVQQKFAASGAGLPVNPAAKSALTDQTLQAVYDFYQKASYVQTYFDVALPTNLGNALNDAVAGFFAGQGTPQSIVDSVNQGSSGGR